MTVFKRIFVVFVALSFLSACVTSSFHTSDQLKERRAQEGLRIVVISPDVELSELTAGGVTIPQADWTETAEGLIKEHVRGQLAGADAQVIYASDVQSDEPISDAENQVVKLHGLVGGSIMLHQYLPGFQLPTKKDKFEWSLGPDVKVLKDKYGADYALFLFVRDSYSSAGRVAVIAIAAILGVGISGGAQVGFASLVDLDTGEVVWFNRLARGTGDLRESEKAAETVEQLLSNFPA